MSLKGILRFFILGAMGIALWIALVVVLGNVSERSQRREQVYSEMAQTSAGAQVIAGPFLALDSSHYVQPKSLRIEGKLQTEKRYRSLYEILLYDSRLKLEGEFEIPKDWLLQAGGSFEKAKPYLVILVQDSRGIAKVPLLAWDGKALEVKPGKQNLQAGFEGGFHSFLPEFSSGERHSFAIDLDLKGMQSFQWVPSGQETEVKLEADWPHPSFAGRSLPLKHEITDKGFTAEWKTTEFSQDISQYLVTRPEPMDLKTQGIGFKLIEPVDIYRQTERSVKYGFLLIVVTFVVFLGFEFLKQLSIHAVQYAFVGLALVLFYVLLLALSEHISFAKAYVTASLASVSLLGFYIRYVVHSWKRALGFSLALLTLDGVIYGILLSEDYALLYGAILLFSLLATAMITTRKVNWSASAPHS